MGQCAYTRIHIDKHALATQACFDWIPDPLSSHLPSDLPHVVAGLNPVPLFALFWIKACTSSSFLARGDDNVIPSLSLESSSLPRPVPAVCMINKHWCTTKNCHHYHHHRYHHIRNNALRASSPALRPVLDIVPVAVAALPFPPTATLPAAFALFAAAATRKRLAPLGRFSRVIVAVAPPAPRDTISTSVTIAIPAPLPPRSRSKRRRNGLGRLSSS